MWAHPGNKLLFMGSELGQYREWSHDRELDWDLLEYPVHGGLQHLVRDLNARYRRTPALWQRDFTSEGFQWLDPAGAKHNVASFLRFDAEGRCGLACVGNFSPTVQKAHRLGLPSEGAWREVLNTDSELYGGGNVGNLGGVVAAPGGWDGQPFSATVALPPLAVVWFAPDSMAGGPGDMLGRGESSGMKEDGPG
jgi:1,4-alpha-glucan branching enzyme